MVSLFAVPHQLLPSADVHQGLPIGTKAFPTAPRLAQLVRCYWNGTSEHQGMGHFEVLLLTKAIKNCNENTGHWQREGGINNHTAQI